MENQGCEHELDELLEEGETYADYLCTKCGERVRSIVWGKSKKHVDDGRGQEPKKPSRAV